MPSSIQFIFGTMLRYCILAISFFFITENKQCYRDSSIPECIQALIQEAKNHPVQNPPLTIYQYDYRGMKVYYVNSPCCDQFNYVLDQECNQLCAPDGGFTGKGDGRCPGFIDSATNKILIWHDERSY